MFKVVSMNYQREMLGQTQEGIELPQGWALKVREKGGMLPEPVCYKTT